jgi:hypothetical protein
MSSAPSSADAAVSGTKCPTLAAAALPTATGTTAAVSVFGRVANSQALTLTAAS